MIMWLIGLGSGSYQETFPANTYGITLCGLERLVIKNQTAHRRGRALAAIRSFFKYAHRAGLLRDNPAADIALPKIRIGEIRALSQDECGRLLRIIERNPSPFRKLRDRAIIVTFLLTGARLREIVQLDKADIDLQQSTIRLHRKGGDINSLPLADAAKIALQIAGNRIYLAEG